MGSSSDACLIGLPGELIMWILSCLHDLADVRSLYGVSHYFQDVVEAALPRWLGSVEVGERVLVCSGTVRFMSRRTECEWSASCDYFNWLIATKCWSGAG